MADQLSSDLASLRIQRDQPPRASYARRALVGVVVLTVLAVAGSLVYSKLAPRLYKQEVAVTEVALVSPSQSSVLVTATGYVVPQSWVKVGAKVYGRLSRVLVKEGDTVKAGDVIAILDRADQESSIAAAQSRVQVARAGAETARANLVEVSQRVARVRSLVSANASPRAELVDLEAREKALAETVRAAEAQIAAANAEVQTWRVGLKDRAIVAPIDGTIITKPAMVGDTVGPDRGGPATVAEIADFRSLVVEADVPEARLGLVAVGTPGEIVLDAYPTRRYRGVTVDIGKRVNRAKATVVVKVSFKDTIEGALPDMSARVSFLREELRPEALKEQAKKVVARDAVAERDGAKVVFVIEEGKLRVRNVALGPPLGETLELVDGPPVGTRVVSRPSSENFDGQRIKERK